MILFEKTYQIIQVNQSNVNDIKEMLNDLLEYYPNIFNWLNRKLNNNIILNDFRISILKSKSVSIGIIITQNKKNYVKVSTLYIKKPYRNQGYGTYFFKTELEYWERRKKHRFLITVSEKALKLCPYFRYFLNKFKFRESTILIDYYLKGENELIFIRESLQHSRPILISIKPKYVELIKNKRKSVEIRKKILKQVSKGLKVYIYESSPSKMIVGYFFIDKILCGNPKKLWETLGLKIAISKQEFNKYCHNRETIFGIYINHLHLFNKGIDIKYLKEKINNWYPPQNMCYCSNQLNNLLEEIN